MAFTECDNEGVTVRYNNSALSCSTLWQCSRLTRCQSKSAHTTLNCLPPVGQYRFAFVWCFSKCCSVREVLSKVRKGQNGHLVSCCNPNRLISVMFRPARVRILTLTLSASFANIDMIAGACHVVSMSRVFDSTRLRLPVPARKYSNSNIASVVLTEPSPAACKVNVTTEHLSVAFMKHDMRRSYWMVISMV